MRKPFTIEKVKRKRKRNEDDSNSMLNSLARKYLRLEKEEEEKEKEEEEDKVKKREEESSASVVEDEQATPSRNHRPIVENQEDVLKCCEMLSEYSSEVELSQSDTSAESKIVNFVLKVLHKSGGSCFEETCKKLVDAIPCENLDLVLVLSRSFLTSDVSPSDAKSFVSLLLLPLVESLSKPASRSLYCAVASASEHHPLALLDALVIPILERKDLGRHQIELIKRIVREHVCSSKHSSVLLSRIVEASYWSESILPIIQTCLNLKNLMISSDLMGSTIRRFDMESQSGSSEFRKSVKFASGLHTLVKKFGSQLDAPQISSLYKILGRCNAFMAKVALKALKRLENKA